MQEDRFRQYAITVKLGARLWLDKTRIKDGQLDHELKQQALRALANDIMDGWIDSNVTEWISVLPVETSFEDVVSVTPWPETGL